MECAEKYPPLDCVAELLAYDAATGKITWRTARNWRRPVGSEAGRLRKDGYREVFVCGKFILAHIVAFALHNGRWPISAIDHKDRNRANNAACNLREASRAEQEANKPARGVIPYKGVTFHKRDKLYCARLRGRTLGYRKSAEDAARLYDEAARADASQFHVLNFP